MLRWIDRTVVHCIASSGCKWVYTIMSCYVTASHGWTLGYCSEALVDRDKRDLDMFDLLIGMSYHRLAMNLYLGIQRLMIDQAMEPSKTSV